MTAQDLINIYISFFEKKPRSHKRIPNSPLVPENDPTTLFTSSGMQPLVPYLLGEQHPQGKRLVDVQNCFRAQDIDEVGDNRHTTFFRMLGNWSLGGYFKNEQLPWFYEFLTKELKIDPKKLYVSVFEGFEDIPKDEESVSIWKEIFKNEGIDPKSRIFHYDAKKNWWSRSGEPKNMPEGEPGGPDSEVFYDFGDEKIHKKSVYKTKPCHINCDCGRYLEIGNSVFMEYKKENGKFVNLPQKNVDFGGGLERLLAASENNPDVFATNLFSPIVKKIEELSTKDYKTNAKQMRLVTDHLVASSFIISAGVSPSNTEQGYVLRRLLRRAFDAAESLGKPNLPIIIESIATQYKETDPVLAEKYENIKYAILEEENTYKKTIERAHTFIWKKYQGEKAGGEIKGVTKISAEDAFVLYSTHGLSPTQIKSLGYEFDEQKFAKKMEEHQNLSRQGAAKKFSGGLADQSEKTVKGHTATHLLHKALKDTLGETVKQAGSNITSERIRFDFTFERKLTDEELKKVEDLINEKIKENLPVSFEIMPFKDAKEKGAIGLFEEKYGDKVKVYSIGGYSTEICGGPHVDFTGRLKSARIIKQENIGKGIRRVYLILGD